MNRISFHLSRRWAWILGGIAVITTLSIVLSFFISSDSLRRHMENQINSRLKEYTVRIERAYLHPIAFSVDLENLTLTQNASPHPPVAYIARLHASIHWRELLRGRLVSDFLMDRPKVHINLKNIRKEEESKVPFQQKGWQDALQSIYPFKINEFAVHNGELTYVDEGPYKPLHVSRINFQASNIRNIRSAKNVFPSSIHLEGMIFDTGTIIMDGHANFLQEPHLGIKADLDLNNMDLSYFDPITNKGNITVSSGTMSAKGNLEYTPSLTAVDFKNMDINGAKINYTHLPQTAVLEKKRIKKTAETVKEVKNEPTSHISIDRLTIEDSSFGYLDKTAKPNFRLFIDHTHLILKNLNNQLKEGESELELKGKFMGTGNTVATGKFRPYAKDTDLEVRVAVEQTQMPAMSDLFRSYGNFDIKKGLFSVYSEIVIKEGRINGYIKPLFKDMVVYDRREKKEKDIFHKLYIGLVSGIAKLLENRPRGRVATKTDISGPAEKPETSTFQIIVNLVKNAFIKSILPGFEKEVTKQKEQKEQKEQ